MGQDVSEKSGSHDRGRVVRRYLSALDARKPGRTTARTAESVAHRMHQIDTLLLSADPVQRLHLTQERIDLHAEVLRLRGTSTGDFAELEKAFVRVARSYGERHDVTYSAWRQVGVDNEVLAQAGIHPQVKPDRRAESTKGDAAATTETAPKANAPAPQAEPKAETPAPAPAPQAEPKAESPAPKAESSKGSPKKSPQAKKAPDAPKDAASANGSSVKPQAKKVPAKKAAESKPEQQQLPAEAHLLS